MKDLWRQSSSMQEQMYEKPWDWAERLRRLRHRRRDVEAASCNLCVLVRGEPAGELSDDLDELVRR